MRLGRASIDGEATWVEYTDGGVAALEASPFAAPTPHAAGPFLPLEAVTVLAPVVPRQMFGAGANFLGKDPSAPPLERPDPAIKPVSSVAAPFQDIPLPADYEGKVIYEAECVAIVGTHCDAVSVSQAEESILGYACANDVSHRGWRADDMTIWRAKGLPGFSPIGPWIETDWHPSRPGAELLLEIDGQVATRTPLSEMRFSFAQVISTISQYVPLWAGDVIWSGARQSVYAGLGQSVVVQVDGIGRLVNHSVRRGGERRLGA
jgi:2-keto-4-pentenoate hydratase/2-oxohepta-3-ene-1,7-dioic acid hydratase in catechol pathway